MRDQSVHVKDTAAWTLGRISELHPDCIKPDLYLQNLVGALIAGLGDSPRVAANCAWVFFLSVEFIDSNQAITNLAETLGGIDEDTPTTVLSVYYEHLLTALLRASER